MEHIKKTVENITKHALAVIERIDEEQVDRMIKTMQSSKSVFIDCIQIRTDWNGICNAFNAFRFCCICYR